MICSAANSTKSVLTKGQQLISMKSLFFLVLLSSSLIILESQAQDLLRNIQRQNTNLNSNNNNNNVNNNPLANIQLPPELASLTPQQLHQLAQLRELQIQQQQQQQAAAGNNNNNNRNNNNNLGSLIADAPAPIGAERLLLPTTQPSPISNAQIPQPNAAASGAAASSSSTLTGDSSSQPTNQPQTSGGATSSSTDTNDRHDDGSYNESGSEMEGVIQPNSSDSSSASGGGTTSQAAASSSSSSSAQQQSAAAAPTFEVNWNKCPQLEPSESEKSKKTQVITKCLQSAPIPSNLTRENVENHREQIATCALKVEGWFDEQSNYRYDKAESEIRSKKLDPTIEVQVLKFHVACKEEANKKFPRDQNKLIDQVQFYQACMDYYISIVCEIEVSVDQ